jgi:hypothetical protein
MLLVRAVCVLRPLELRTTSHNHWNRQPPEIGGLLTGAASERLDPRVQRICRNLSLRKAASQGMASLAAETVGSSGGAPDVFENFYQRVGSISRNAVQSQRHHVLKPRPQGERGYLHRSDERAGRQIGNQFKAFAEAVKLVMKTQPNYSPDDSAQISVPVVIAHSAPDEFIRREHAGYLARTIPMPESPRHAITIQYKPRNLRANFSIRNRPCKKS